MEQLIGKTLGQYEILGEIGRGGMATVYRGLQTSLNRPVAIKVLSGELARDPGFRERFQREAHAVAQLAHPNILPVYDFGQDAATGIVYFVTQYVEGGTLAGRMGSQLPPEEAARIAAQIARALDCAHARGIIHRDVKPANVLVTREGHPLLSDFGIAKIVAETTLTQTGASLGTPAYMSPEQALGSPVDHRSDIYALGVMLYEMLAGVLPFQADTPVALLHQHVAKMPPPLRERVPNVSRNLEKIVMRALAKDPDERYATAGEFAQALEDEIAGRRKLFGISRQRAKATPAPASTATQIVGESPGSPPDGVSPSPVPSRLKLDEFRQGTPPRLGAAVTKVKVRRAAKGFSQWLLRAVLSVLVIFLVAGIVLLIAGSLALGTVAEQTLSSQRWVLNNILPGSVEHVACADIQSGVGLALQPYLLDALTDVKAICRSPDLVEVSGKFRGGPVSLSARVYAERGVPAVRLERLNNMPLYIIGGIISGGANRGMAKSWANAPVRLRTFTVSGNGIEIIYEANPNMPAP